MLITRESEYAMRMVRALADNKIKPVRKICNDEQLPQKWAYKILKKMEHASIVKSFYGVNGGYRLDKDITEITLFDMLALSPNSLRFNECTYDLNDRCNVQLDECSINKEFKRLEHFIKSELQERTMDKVIGEID